jgi:hypothetical protein
MHRSSQKTRPLDSHDRRAYSPTVGEVVSSEVRTNTLEDFPYPSTQPPLISVSLSLKAPEVFPS